MTSLKKRIKLSATKPEIFTLKSHTHVLPNTFSVLHMNRYVKTNRHTDHTEVNSSNTSVSLTTVTSLHTSVCQLLLNDAVYIRCGWNKLHAQFDIKIRMNNTLVCEHSYSRFQHILVPCLNFVPSPQLEDGLSGASDLQQRWRVDDRSLVSSFFSPGPLVPIVSRSLYTATASSGSSSRNMQIHIT